MTGIRNILEYVSRKRFQSYDSFEEPMLNKRGHRNKFTTSGIMIIKIPKLGAKVGTEVGPGLYPQKSRPDTSTELTVKVFTPGDTSSNFGIEFSALGTHFRVTYVSTAGPSVYVYNAVVSLIKWL